MRRLSVRLVQSGVYDGESFAHDFAERHKRRVKRIHALTDGGVAEVFAVSVRKGTNATLRITCGAQAVTGDIDRVLPWGMACSIGAPLPHVTFESRYRAGRDDELPVFITSRNSERVPDLLQSPVLLSALESCALEADEYVQTVHAIGFSLLRPSQERVEKWFDGLERVASAFPGSSHGTLPARYPSVLRPISSLVLEWGILDAKERQERIAGAHPDALRRLLESARFYAPKIEKYLRSTRYPRSEAAHMISAFMEATVLAEIRMENVAPIRRSTRLRTTGKR